jgi:hypothetical protein
VAHESLHTLTPHVYLVAGAAYRAMVREGASQSIVINGESGAGEGLRGCRGAGVRKASGERGLLVVQKVQKLGGWPSLRAAAREAGAKLQRHEGVDRWSFRSPSAFWSCEASRQLQRSSRWTIHGSGSATQCSMASTCWRAAT